MENNLFTHSMFRWIPFASLSMGLVFFDILAAILSFDVTTGFELVLGAVIGAVFAQVVVTAVMTVMLPAHFLTRLIAGLVTTLLICLALLLHTRSARPPIPYVLAGTAFCQWLIYQIPLWSLRVSGWSLDQQSRNVETANGNETQFGIQQILIWTAIVAVFLAVSRFIYGMASDVESPTSVDWLVFGILTLGNSVLALPIMWGAFVRRRVLLWIGGAIVWSMLLTPAQLLLLKWAIPIVGEEIWIFVSLDIVQMLVSFMLLLSMRFAGLRLLRPTQLP